MRDAAPVVCLVDDDESVRKSIVRVLGSAGFKVQAFSEPDAFLRHLRMHSVPVAILDIWMDNMTVMHAGAFAFFVKPFDNKRFLQAVQDALCAAPTRDEART